MPEKVAPEKAVSVPKEKDNRKELMVQLNTIKTVISHLQDHQTVDKLKTQAVKAERVINLLARVVAGAEVANKIVRFNSSDSEIVGAAASLYTHAASLSNKLDEIKVTKEKIRMGQEMHNLALSVNKFLQE